MEKSEPCEHEWKKFTETVPIAPRTEKQLNAGMAFKGSKAYFIVKACVKCKAKQYMDYKIEGI